jgi:Bacterial protein of unknown function (DUF885)
VNTLFGTNAYVAAGPQRPRAGAGPADGVHDDAGRERGRLVGDRDAAQVPQSLRGLGRAAAASVACVGELRRWMLDDYAPRTEGVPDGTGAGLYPVLARAWLGNELDLSGTYVGGWSECHRIMAQMAELAERVLPGATVREAMSYLETTAISVTARRDPRWRP